MTCNHPMCAVAGSGYLYCDREEGHDGQCSKTFEPGLYWGFPVPSPLPQAAEEGFESLWKCLPAAYDPEIKELYKNVYLAGYRDGRSLSS